MFVTSRRCRTVVVGSLLFESSILKSTVFAFEALPPSLVRGFFVQLIDGIKNLPKASKDSPSFLRFTKLFESAVALPDRSTSFGGSGSGRCLSIARLLLVFE